jgi:hypothetical protein
LNLRISRISWELQRDFIRISQDFTDFEIAHFVTLSLLFCVPAAPCFTCSVGVVVRRRLSWSSVVVANELGSLRPRRSMVKSCLCMTSKKCSEQIFSRLLPEKSSPVNRGCVNRRGHANAVPSRDATTPPDPRFQC